MLRNIVVLSLLVFLASPVSALTINTHYLGGTAPSNTVGTGDLQTIFQAAAHAWESYIKDSFVIDISYGWGNTIGGSHRLDSQGGTPNRETAGTIYFGIPDKNGGQWFLDSTPLENTEWGVYTETPKNFGSGSLIAGRVFTRATGNVSTSHDLFSTALHMIGRALGLARSNTVFHIKVADGAISILPPRPFPGSIIPLQASGCSGVLARPAVMSCIPLGERVLISDVDVLAIAEVSDFRDILLPSQSGP